MSRSVFGLCLILLFLLTLPARGALERLSVPPEPPSSPRRIISLAPSVTETLYALGLGEQVAGVTQFCAWPPDVESKAVVAGFSDVNFEAVVRALPDLIALPIDKTENRSRLELLGFPVLTLDTRSLVGLIESIERLGAATGHTAEAETLIRDFEAAIRDARERAEGKKPPRVLFSVMHSYQGLGHITEISAIGADGFYNELIRAAGGVNAYQGTLPFPRLSRESIIFLDPDVIIDVIPRQSEDIEAVRRDWASLVSVKAIRDNRLHILTNSGDTVPGPRSVQTLSTLSRAFHPDKPEPHERGP